jgi:hypothetical protein
MAAETSSTFDGWFKDVYVDNGKDLVPEWALLGEMIGFDSANRTGKEYVKAVLLRIPHGATYGTTGTAYTLNSAIPLQTQDARVSGASFHLREDIAVDVIESGKTTKQAFRNTFDTVVMGMTKASYLYRELPLIYGGAHMGAFSSSDPGATTAATWTFTDATWAPGLWAQLEGASVDVFDQAADGGTKRNTGGPITVGVADPSARTVAVTGDNVSLAAIYAANPTNYVKPVGSDSKWFKGLKTIVPHASSTLFGIDASTYALWRGNTTSAGSVKLTFSTINKAANLTLARGGYGKKVLLVSNATWADLNNDSAEFRSQVNKTGGDFSLGVEDITFYAATGHVKVVMHPMLMRGEAYMINPDVFTRIGSCDHTWGVDGAPDKFLSVNENSASIQIRCRWEQALMADDLSQNCQITGIVPNAAG